MPSLADDKIWFRGSDDIYDDEVTSIHCRTEAAAIICFDCACNVISKYAIACRQSEIACHQCECFDDYCIIGEETHEF